MKKVFVSGCYDILHAGHVQFFKDALSLGDHLTVCFASSEVLMLAKGRVASMPDDNKKTLLEAVRYVNEAVPSSDLDPIFDFKSHIENIKPDILAVTEDDKNVKLKEKFCAERGIELVVVPKNNYQTRVSTSSIRETIKKSK